MPLQWTGKDRRVQRGEFDDLKQQVKELKSEVGVNTELTRDIAQNMQRNTELTESVYAILKGFRLVAAVAKWVTVVGGAVTLLWHGLTGFIATHVSPPHP